VYVCVCVCVCVCVRACVRHQQFDRALRDVEVLRTVTKPQLLEWVRANIVVNAPHRRKLTSQVNRHSLPLSQCVQYPTDDNIIDLFVVLLGGVLKGVR